MDLMDVNAVLGPLPHYRSRLAGPAAVLAEMERLGITEAWVRHSYALAYDPLEGNRETAVLVRDEPRFRGVWVMTPLMYEEFGGRDALLRELAAGDFAALTACPAEHAFSLELWNAAPIYEMAVETGLPLLLDLSRGLAPTQVLEHVHEAAGAYPEAQFILLSISYRLLRMLIPLLRQRPNVHVDISNFDTFRGVEALVEAVGPRQLLYGSQLPFFEPGMPLGRLIYADITAADRELIAHGNARRLLAGRRLYGGV